MTGGMRDEARRAIEAIVLVSEQPIEANLLGQLLELGPAGGQLLPLRLDHGGRCLGDEGRGNVAAGAGLGFHHDGLAEFLRQLVGHDARDHVGIAAGGKAVHQRNRP